MGNPRSRLLINTALAVAIAMAAPAAFAAPANEWTLELQGRAKVAGEVTVLLTPAGGDATRVSIPIPAATNHEAAAVIVSNEMTKRLGTGTYHVETDGIDDVKVKSIDGARDFDMAIERNTTDGLTVELDRD